MKKVFAVAINYNKENITREWLDSMQRLDMPKEIYLEIIIVDNASKVVFTLDKKKQKPNVHIIRSEDNTGFTGGNNIGMRFALAHHADYILIINNDTIVDKNLVKNLLSVLDSNAKIAMVAPKIYFAKGHEFHKDRYKEADLGKVFWYAGGYTDWANVKSVHRGVDEVDRGQFDANEKIDFASGCCMLIKSEVLRKIGLFDDRCFMYFEDAILNEKIKRAGYEIWYVPRAMLWHLNAASSGGSGNQLQDYFLTRNQMLFGMMYAPLRTKLALIRQSWRYLLSGRPKQQQAIKDFYIGKFGKGTYFQVSS